MNLRGSFHVGIAEGCLVQFRFDPPFVVAENTNMCDPVYALGVMLVAAIIVLLVGFCLALPFYSMRWVICTPIIVGRFPPAEISTMSHPLFARYG